MAKPTKAQIGNAVQKSRFSFGTGSEFADKAKLAAAETIFTITGITFKERGGFLDQKAPTYRKGDLAPDAWEVGIEIDGDPKVISFGSNAKRDEIMQGAKDDIDEHGPMPDCVLARSGQAYYINQVDTDVLT